MSKGHKAVKTSQVEKPMSVQELKKQLFIALEVLNGSTEQEAEANWKCENGECECP